MQRSIFLVCSLLLLTTGCNQTNSLTSPLATQNFDSSTTEKLSILPLGDSITQAAKDRNSYRRSLYQKLVAAGHNVDFVGSMTKTKDCTDYPARDFDFDHEGHWAWRIDEIIEGRNARCYGKGKLADWLKNYAPDLALIHLGSNDAFQGNSVASSIAELKQVVQILRQKNPNIVIFLAQLIGAKDKQRNQTIIKLNEQIPTLAAELDRANSPVIVVDQYTDFNPRRDTYDGIHPNQRGEAKMAQKWFEAINAYLKSAR